MANKLFLSLILFIFVVGFLRFELLPKLHDQGAPNSISTLTSIDQEMFSPDIDSLKEIINNKWKIILTDTLSSPINIGENILNEDIQRISLNRGCSDPVKFDEIFNVVEKLDEDLYKLLPDAWVSVTQQIPFGRKIEFPTNVDLEYVLSIRPKNSSKAPKQFYISCRTDLEIRKINDVFVLISTATNEQSEGVGEQSGYHPTILMPNLDWFRSPKELVGSNLNLSKPFSENWNVNLSLEFANEEFLVIEELPDCCDIPTYTFGEDGRLRIIMDANTLQIIRGELLPITRN